MTFSTAVHSNAFNFMSFIQNGVDPRTGQYTLAINLPALQSHDLNGPEFPVSLNYNPLNTLNSGYGTGWDLRLSQYTPSTRILALSTGETFKATGSADGLLVFKEQKLDSFKCFDDGGGWYRVVHKSGQVEFLKVQGTANNQVALPMYIESAQGHRLVLEYLPYRDTVRLASVSDGAAILLAISNSGNAVHIDQRPGAGADGQAWARYSLQLSGDGRVERIVLPSSPVASWRLSYELVRGLLCLKTVRSPTGSVETLEYLDEGHIFPAGAAAAGARSGAGAVLSTRASELLRRFELKREQRAGAPEAVHEARRQAAARPPLPRVTKHLTDPGFGQPPLEVRYTYTLDGAPSVNNFVGGGLNDVIFEDDGFDNIYKTRTQYRYGTVETHYVAGAATRSIVRTFNKYHLLTQEKTTQNHSTKTVTTLYHINEELPFDLQPPQVQLPSEVATLWWDEADGGTYIEREFTSFDRAGNPTQTRSANGVREVSSWYPAEGAEGCPADPYGFVRQLREKITYPADSGHSDAPVLGTRYRYGQLAPLDSAAYPAGGVPTVPGSTTPWLAPISELQVSLDGNENATEVQHTATTYLQVPNDPAQHGRAKSLTLTLGGSTSFPAGGAPVTVGGYASTTAYTYEKIPASARLKTTETLTTFDTLEKVVTREASLLTGNTLLDRDDNDVEIETQYNALDQVIAETAAPNTPERATRRYEYRLVNQDGEQAEQRVIDVKGVETRTYLDGLNRVIKEERQTSDSATRANAFVQTYAATYDGLGQLASETELDIRLGDAPVLDDTEFAVGEWDWLSEESLALTTTYAYDDWGQQRSAIGPDGVEEHELNDPITRVTSAWRPGIGKTLTYNNLFDKPEWVERRNLDGTLYSRETSEYDGLGRLRKSLDAMRNQTTYSYDVFDRLTNNVLPDGAAVKREFAPHSSEDLPTSISVVENSSSGPVAHLLGTQEFDGLSRLTYSVTGNRARRNTYQGSQAQPAFVHTPAGDVIAYTYKPHLSDEPITRHIEGGPTQALYSLDQHNARLLSGSESGHEFTREYFSTGELKSERRVDGAGQHEMSYVYSLGGRLLSYTDVAGSVQTHTYDLAGRLAATRLGSTHTTLTYNASGLNDSIHTTDQAINQQVNVDLEYDQHGRESTRTFDLGAGLVQVLAQHYTVLDQMDTRVLSEAGNELRAEEFYYDARGHLVGYTASGPEAPFDPANKQITGQVFLCDALDNHVVVLTEFKDANGAGENMADYQYSPLDPAQLVQISNDHPEYAARFDMSLTYDGNGCLLVDEEGRELQYDALSRLVKVKPQGADELTYGYDALDILSAAASERRFYRAGELVSLVEGDGEVRTIVRAGEALVAEHHTASAPKA